MCVRALVSVCVRGVIFAPTEGPFLVWSFNLKSSRQIISLTRQSHASEPLLKVDIKKCNYVIW